MLALGACGEPAATDETASAASGAGASAPAYAAIDRERLLSVADEPGQWLTSGRDFGKTHYSPLTDINKETAARLGFAWSYETGTTRGLEATPTVVDGVMYTSGTTGRVYALRADTGEELWKFDPESDGQVNRWTCCDEVNRGVAVWDGVVYVASLDGRMFGLDAENGAVLWEVDTIIDHDRGYSSTGAPEVAGSVVIIGNAGSDYDARGYVSAYDLKTGEFKWRFFVTPRDPDLGPQEHKELEEIALPTWDPESRWDVGGGGTPWGTIIYDPELNLVYVGTGNASLFNWHERSPAGGDNLFLSSILAINPDTGELAWHYQETPRESWDYTSVQPFFLTDLEIDGAMRQVLMHAPKNGFFYVLDRATGELLRAEKFVPVNWATHVDLETGRPVIDEEAVDYSNATEPKWVVPSGMGGHSWNPMAWDPERKLAFIPTIEGGSVTWDPTDGHTYRPKMANSGTSILFGDSLYADPDNMAEPMASALREVQASGEHVSQSALKAFDPLTGEVKWERRHTDWWDRAGVLATAGGVLFQGDDRGMFRVIDSDTGEVLKELNVGTSIMAAPMTYTIDGVQYVSVMAAWGGGGWFAPHPTSAVQTYGNQGRIITFRLDGTEPPLPPEIDRNPVIPEPPMQTASAETIAEGSRLFGSCRTCHANRPDGMTPDLRSSGLLHSVDGFKAVVLEGALRMRGMPQWDDVLSAEDTEAIHAYLIDEAWKAYRGEEREIIPSETAH
jgi:quinohemoprotein ethanol dehydrogenase